MGGCKRTAISERTDVFELAEPRVSAVLDGHVEPRGVGHAQ